MKSRLLIIAALAAAALSGCATYDHVGASAAGGYYQGRPVVRYYDAYGYPVYGGYYGGYYNRPSYYGRQPYYGYYGPYYPYYPPPVHRPRPGHDHGGYRPPPGSGPGGNRPAPWRDPTRGAWREHGQQPASLPAAPTGESRHAAEGLARGSAPGLAGRAVAAAVDAAQHQRASGRGAANPAPRRTGSGHRELIQGGRPPAVGPLEPKLTGCVAF